MNNIQKTVFKVSDFVSWKRSGSLVLSPAFQRRPVWPKGAKSYLIDTVVRGIPMPIIFLRSKTDPDTLEPLREVVDGQQRLRTILSFIEPALLKDFDQAKDGFTVESVHNGDLAGHTFKELSSEIRQRILDYDFSVHVLPADTEDRDVLQIFGRMNSTGYKLNDQELRNAEFFGAFKERMYQLAYEQLDRWRVWRVFSESDIARMIEVEETSDMVLTMLLGVHGKSQKLLKENYQKYDSVFPSDGEATKRFRAVLDAIDNDLRDFLPTSEFRRKPLFHTLFTFYYDLMFGIGSTFKRATAKPVGRAVAKAVRLASEQISSGTVPPALSKVLRGATGHKPARQKRLEFLHETLKFGASR